MARKPRITIPGYPYHIMLRGNNRSIIFYDDKDRSFFIDCVKIAKEKTKSAIYSYCLMNNHVHFIIEPTTENGLSAMLQSVGRRYVKYMNKRHERSGTLWEGRFKSNLINRDEYLLACCRYVELNPVRARIVDFPERYKWSSYCAKANGAYDLLLDCDEKYFQLGVTAKERQDNYKAFVCSGIRSQEQGSFQELLSKSMVLGRPEFCKEIEKVSGVRVFKLKPGRQKGKKGERVELAL